MTSCAKAHPSAQALSTTLAWASTEERGMECDSNPPFAKPRYWRIAWYLIFLLPLAVAVALIVTTGWWCSSTSIYRGYEAYMAYMLTYMKWGCDPAGKMWVFPGQPSIWSLETSLYPTIPVFKSTLSIVRTVDILWDLVIGRGYRGFCAILIYQVFRTALTDIMRNELLPHEEVLALEYSTVSIRSLSAYAKSALRAVQMWRGRPTASPLWTMSVLVLATAYTFAAPTWLSALTSYQNVMRPMLSTDLGLVSFHQIKLCLFVVADGNRIGLEDDICVDEFTELAASIETYLETTAVKACYPNHDVYALPEPPRKDCNHPSILSLPGGQVVHLTSPVLSILHGASTYQNRTLSPAHLLEYGRCEPQQNQYQWGFSFLILFTFMLATVVVAICVSVTWYQYTDRLWPQQVDMMFGKIRTALVVAASVKDRAGKGMYEMTEKELSTGLTRSDGIGHVHAGSHIMFTPGPHEERKSKSECVLPVSSDGYNTCFRRKPK